MSGPSARSSPVPFTGKGEGRRRSNTSLSLVLAGGDGRRHSNASLDLVLAQGGAAIVLPIAGDERCHGNLSLKLRLLMETINVSRSNVSVNVSRSVNAHDRTEERR